jgi:Mut7-C RNAse domain
VRFLVDSNIVAQAMRAAGYDVAYLGERAADPGDRALLAEAVAEGRIILTKLPHPPSPEGRVGVSWSIVIGSRTVACCFSTIWVMLPPNLV